MSDDDTLLLPQEAADYLRMKKQTLANWRSQGGGPEYTRVGNRIFYLLSKLREFIRIYTCTSDYGKPRRRGAQLAAKGGSLLDAY